MANEPFPATGAPREILTMSTKTVKIIDQRREVVATAQVTQTGERFAGLIDLSPMPASLRERFEEYEEIVNGQMFSLLDEIEEQIGAVPLKAVFEGGCESVLEELQIYPSTRRVTFKIAHPAQSCASYRTHLDPSASREENDHG